MEVWVVAHSLHCVCVHAHVHMYVEARGLHWILFLKNHTSCFLFVYLFWERLNFLISLAGWAASFKVFLPLPRLMAFQVWALGIEVRSSWMHDKLFTNWPVSPILQLAFLTYFPQVSLSGESNLGTSDFRYYHSSWWFSIDGQFCIREPLEMSGGILGYCSSLGDGTSL